MPDAELVDLVLDVIDEAASIAPEAGILYIFWQVRKNNVASGRNTSGSNGINIPLSNFAAADAASVTKLAGALGLSAQQMANALAQVVVNSGNLASIQAVAAAAASYANDILKALGL